MSRSLNWMTAYRAGAVILVLVGIGIAFPNVFTSAFETKTDFAFVRADIVPIRANTTNLVRTVYVTVGQHVTVGDPLVDLDQHELNLRIAEQRAELVQLKGEAARIKHELRLQPMQLSVAEAGLDLAGQNQELAQQQFDRIADLRSDDAISVLEFENFDQTLNTSSTMQQTAARLLEIEQARTQGLEEALRLAQQNIVVAKERLALTEAGSVFATLRAPVTGRVAKMRVHDGQVMTPGETYLWLVSDAFWIEARFRENDVTAVHEGSAVEVVLDAYPGLQISGRVSAVSTASSAEFSALPTRRGAGNFTKVVQWIPVRVEFDRATIPGTLASGMSAEVRLVRDAS